jgi:hypothetical protein
MHPGFYNVTTLKLIKYPSQHNSLPMNGRASVVRAGVRVSFEEKEMRVFAIALALALTLTLFLYPERTKVATSRS